MCRMSSLSNIFSSAHALGQQYFDVELPHRITTNNDLWKKFTDHDAVRKIPLPRSSTPLARQMRVAAFLAFLAHEMRGHVFQPTYLLRDNTDLNCFLNRLSRDESNPEREPHLRSVLLAAGEWVPELTDSVVASQVNTVVTKVSKWASSLVPEDKIEGLRSELAALCEKTCREWRRIQTLESKVEVDFEADEDDKSCWQPFFEISTPAEPRQKAPRSNGAASGSGSNKKLPPLDAQAQIEAIGRVIKAEVVWPVFYDDALDALAQGHLLTGSQIFMAMGEEKAQSPTGPHRSRRMSERATSKGTNGPEMKKPQNKSFLLPDHGGGQGGS